LASQGGDASCNLDPRRRRFGRRTEGRCLPIVKGCVASGQRRVWGGRREWSAVCEERRNVSQVRSVALCECAGERAPREMEPGAAGGKEGPVQANEAALLRQELWSSRALKVATSPGTADVQPNRAIQGLRKTGKNPTIPPTAMAAVDAPDHGNSSRTSSEVGRVSMQSRNGERCVAQRH
jgi:hypothetical protein